MSSVGIGFNSEIETVLMEMQYAYVQIKVG